MKNKMKAYILMTESKEEVNWKKENLVQYAKCREFEIVSACELKNDRQYNKDMQFKRFADFIREEENTVVVIGNVSDEIFGNQEYMNTLAYFARHKNIELHLVNEPLIDAGTPTSGIRYLWVVKILYSDKTDMKCYMANMQKFKQILDFFAVRTIQKY